MDVTLSKELPVESTGFGNFTEDESEQPFSSPKKTENAKRDTRLQGFMTEEGANNIDYSFSRKTAGFDRSGKSLREAYSFGAYPLNRQQSSESPVTPKQIGPDFNEEGKYKDIEENNEENEENRGKEAAYEEMPSLHLLENDTDFGIYKYIQTKKAELDSRVY